MTELLARLGNVIYWLFTGVAALFVLGGAYIAVFGLGQVKDEWWPLAVGAGFAIVSWLIGRAARFILAGK